MVRRNCMYCVCVYDMVFSHRILLELHLTATRTAVWKQKRIIDTSDSQPAMMKWFPSPPPASYLPFASG